jgi:NAD(P)-dependent dehydrogenase (short-subunit alcohol dehydrogenase family)
VHEPTPAEWDRVIHNNLRGYFLTARRALPVMMAQRAGVLLFVTSETIQTVTLYVAAYGAAKGGATALMKAIAAEYGEYGIRANCLQIGATPGTAISKALVQSGADMGLVRESRKKPIPLVRFGTPEDHAGGLVYLASDEAAWVTGTTLNVDGGYTCI